MRRLRLRVVPAEVRSLPEGELAAHDCGASVRSAAEGLEGVFPSQEAAEGYAAELRGIGAECVVVSGGFRVGVLRLVREVVREAAVESLSHLVREGVVHRLVVLSPGCELELLEEGPSELLEEAAAAGSRTAQRLALGRATVAVLQAYAAEQRALGNPLAVEYVAACLRVLPREWG